MILTLKRAAVCAECGASLAVGSCANWYRNGAVYGLDCHARKPRARARENEPLGQTLSRLDPKGFYAPDGRLLGRARCNHEDYPCCGC
jgi:hypothetical protein